MSDKKTLVTTLKRNTPLTIKHNGEEMIITYVRNLGKFQVSLVFNASENFEIIRSDAKLKAAKDVDGK